MKALIIFPVLVLVLIVVISSHAEPEPAGIPDMPSLLLTGVLGDGVNGSAIINGTVVRAGETISNVTLVAIENKGAKLQYKNQSIFLKIGGSTANGDGIQASQASISASNVTSTTMADAVQKKRGTLYADLLKRRMESQGQKTNTNMVNLTPEQRAKTIQEYQMDAIRKGLPPLPVPLTKESDDQLVKEGVLPPMQENVANRVRAVNPPVITNPSPQYRMMNVTVQMFLAEYSDLTGKKIAVEDGLHDVMNFRSERNETTVDDTIKAMEAYLAVKHITLIPDGTNAFKAVRVKKPEDHQ